MMVKLPSVSSSEGGPSIFPDVRRGNWIGSLGPHQGEILEHPSCNADTDINGKESEIGKL